MAKLNQQAKWLRSEYPSAAVSVSEGLEETFTINRLGLPPKLRRCLVTTNIMESPTAGVRLRTRRVTNLRGGEMAFALGRRGVPGYGEELPEKHRLPGVVGIDGGVGGKPRTAGGDGGVGGEVSRAVGTFN